MMSAQSFKEDTLQPAANAELDYLRSIRKIISTEQPYLPTFLVHTLEKLGDGDRPKFPVKKVICFNARRFYVCSSALKQFVHWKNWTASRMHQD